MFSLYYIKNYNMLKKCWLTESNRIKHLIGGLILGLLLTIFCSLGAAGGMEFKDAHHANGDKPFKEWDWSAWDWKDFWATMIGGVIGGSINLLIILLIFFK